MKLFCLWLGLVAVALGAAPAGKEARLEKLKKDFPAHVAGPDVEKMHPVARECFEALKRDVDRLSTDLLAQQAVQMAEKVNRALHDNHTAANDQDNIFGSSGRWAAKRNTYWLEERVKPWLRKVANVAQGKS